MGNLDYWKSFDKPPKEALREIRAGRLSGKTDINPQWRYKAMTEVFGPCGIGWRYTVDRKWTEQGTDGQVFAFADISLYIRVNNEWSEAIPGSGGSMLIAKEKNGLHSNDEAFKMATTDALSVAMKTLGVAAEVYAGNWDGSGYRSDPVETIGDEAAANIHSLATEVGADIAKFCKYFKIKEIGDLPVSRYEEAVKLLEAKRK